MTELQEYLEEQSALNNKVCNLEKEVERVEGSLERLKEEIRRTKELIRINRYNHEHGSYRWPISVVTEGIEKK